MRTCCAAAAALVAAALVAGCGDSSTGEVTGTVTIDGQVPMNGASIAFIPADGKSAQAGDTLKDGKYKVKVAAGACKVSIVVPEPVGGKAAKPEAGPGAGPGGGDRVRAVPLEQSEFTFEVKPGAQVKDWEVSRKK
jgi:hypothetical protein